MKKFLTVLFAMSLMVSAWSLDVPGKVFFKNAENKLVHHEVTLELPAKGEGKIYLKDAHHKIEAHAFKSVERNGRVVFYIVFLGAHHLLGLTQTSDACIFKGTYVRGDNKAVYYGDIFTKKPAEGIELENLDHDHHGDMEYKAGFFFKADVNP